ncbi:hypothetical protein MKW92_048058 [Papaver armeniacum]|nr:hypothetical protein MKW92_048058 [Papaver armeniacum]
MISIVEQFEVASAFTTITSGTSENTKVVIEQGAIPIFVAHLSSPSDDPAFHALGRLINSTDEEVLTDACGALSYLYDGTNDKIQVIIEVIACCRHVELLLQKFLLQSPISYCTHSFPHMVGNIVTGDDRQTQYKERNLLDYLKHYCWKQQHNVLANFSEHIKMLDCSRASSALLCFLHWIKISMSPLVGKRGNSIHMTDYISETHPNSRVHQSCK